MREAHTEGQDQIPRILEEDIIYRQPETSNQRVEIASACMLHYNFSFSKLLDSMDNEAEEKYFSLPGRLHIISIDGKISYRGGLCPHYFDVNEFEKDMSDIVLRS